MSVDFGSYWDHKDWLQICTIIPLVKGTSDNYWAVEGKCLLFKLKDEIIFMLEGEKLGFVELQFLYQMSASRTMCTWQAIYFIEFVNKGTSTTSIWKFRITLTYINFYCPNNIADWHLHETELVIPHHIRNKWKKLFFNSLTEVKRHCHRIWCSTFIFWLIDYMNTHLSILDDYLLCWFFVFALLLLGLD